jgi:hypothetical protein
MGASHTAHEDKINWRDTPTGGEGQSRLGRYIHTRHEDGTFDVEFVSQGRWEVIRRRVPKSEAYDASVEDNKKRLGITGGGSESGAARRRQDAPLCPECHMAHNGECL